MSPRAPRVEGVRAGRLRVGGQAARFHRDSDRRRLRAMAVSLACAGFLVALILGVVGLRVQQVRLSYRLDALRAARTELEETRNRLRVELATLKSLARIEGKARAELGMVLPAPRSGPARPRVRPGRHRPHLARAAHGGRRPGRTARSAGAPVAGDELAHADRHRSSAGFAGALCSRGEASAGRRSPPPSVCGPGRSSSPRSSPAPSSGLLGRLAYLQIVKHDEYARLADNQHAKTIPLKPKRGPILDRERPGPRRVLPGGVALRAHLAGRGQGRASRARLAPILGEPGARDRQAGSTLAKRFVFVKRRLPPDTVEAVRDLGEPALGFVDESMRLYPNRELAAHVVGFEGMDGKGLAGRRAGVGRAPRGRRGAGARRARRPRPRDHRRAQGAQAVHGGAGRRCSPSTPRCSTSPRRRSTRRGGARAPRRRWRVAMDPRTGEILALAIRPTFNPNSFGAATDDERRNRARHRPLRARLDVQGDPGRRRPRGGRGAPDRPLLRGERRHHGGQRHDPRLEEVRLAHVHRGAPELLQRGLDQGRPLARQGALLQVHLGLRLRRPDGRGPDRGEPRPAPPARRSGRASRSRPCRSARRSR